MNTNMGKSDRVIRLVAALVIVALFVAQMITGAGGVLLLIVGGVLLVTALLGFCPLYRMLGINSCTSRQKPPQQA